MIDTSYPEEVEEAAWDLGLERTLAYHCKRCNYLWFPKDFEPVNRRTGNIVYVGENIFELEPPKACARCKSRYWMKHPVRQSNSVESTGYRDTDFAGIHKMDSVPRLRALHRQGKLGFVVDGCNCKYCNTTNSSD